MNDFVHELNFSFILQGKKKKSQLDDARESQIRRVYNTLGCAALSN